ncbi:MAG TPA: hypothetical protein VFZ64_04155 [Nocardioidaceae bacterium]
MAAGAPVTDTSTTHSTDASRARLLVLVSAVFLALQVVNTDYGTGVDARGTAGLWFVVGVGFLWFVYRRRSRLARSILLVTSLGGAVAYSLVALENADAVLLAVFFLG